MEGGIVYVVRLLFSLRSFRPFLKLLKNCLPTGRCFFKNYVSRQE